MAKFNWRVYGSALAVNLLSFASGIAYSWTSPVLPKINGEKDSDDNPLNENVTPFEESWIASILSLGAAIGPLLACAFVDRSGRKKILLFISAPIMISYIILAFAQKIVLYYVARFLLGLGIGCVYSIVPIYIGEIAENSNRGALGCMMNIMYTLGSVFSFGLGPFVTIKTFSLICIVPVAVFVVIFGIFVPESPYYLLVTNRKSEAHRSLSRLRRGSVSKELGEISKHIQETCVDQKLRKSLKSKVVIKGFIIGTGLMIFQQFSGITVVISYMQSIFEAAGTSLSSDISSIVIGIINVISNIITSQIVDRLGRRILLIGSLLGSSISQITLGFYFHLKTLDYDVENYSLVPIICLMVFLISFSLGIGPVSWAIVGEIFPQQVKSVANTFSSVVNITSAFLLTMFYPNLNALIGISFSFWLFGGFCFLGIIFVVLFVPETKGKSLHEIQVLLGEMDYEAPTHSEEKTKN